MNAAQSTAHAVANNRRTIQSYEHIARGYADSTRPEDSYTGDAGLRRLTDVVGVGGQVLELGSGPGWDADLVESRGVSVRRTDITQAFLDLQRERGKRVERLDLISDELGGPYDGVMALCVVQHIGRELVPGVLIRVATALRPNGIFLVSVREGFGERWEGEYHTVLWDRPRFSAALAAAGMAAEWVGRTVYSEGPWLTFTARKH
jgi:SAM-dependent methyltransferase